MPQRFNWLHLTDLHYGQAGQRPLWPNVREAFFEDLRRLHERCGPWHAVLFTGDLVYSGAEAEFDEMGAEVLGRLWKELESLGSGGAVLLAVPGNHDLQRPKLSAAVRQLVRRQDGFAEVEEEFWSDPASEYRQVVDAALAAFGGWWSANNPGARAKVTSGLLPGDFATTIEAGRQRIGIVGLNTTFLQLTPGDFRGRLAWDVRQLHAVCGDVPDWLARHNASLLLTHQGPDWLDTRSQATYAEINPAGRFAAHLFGHMHETVMRATSLGGGKPLRQWQGSSLFGLEKFGEPPTLDRRHGYSAGSLEFDLGNGTIRLWPRRAAYDANGWRPVPDHESCVLLDDEGTAPEAIAGETKRGKKRRQPSTRAEARATPADERALVGVYTQATRTLWDIIDLAGLPEDDRHLAMQQFMLRQLYLPLRMTIEPVLTEDELAALEEKREETRLAAAGRAAVETRKPPERTSLGAWLTSVLSSASGKSVAGQGGPSPPRLVVLGDPGGGKSTLLRWFATACLLRREGDPDFFKLPDADSLPAADWLPILVRCRDLDKERAGQATLEELLRYSLAKMQLDKAQLEPLAAFLRRELQAGRAVLLLDGLDEITDPGPRAAFCERIETIAKLFPRAPILATSRIVGYRETRRRLREDFAHATLAELAPAEKDAFIDRWCEVTIKDPARRATEAEKLRRGIHGTDRIERLTTNPMLLTTMALVQRKVGKLPPKRHKLYWEAVGVLLNWRSEVEDPMDPDEALPQLEYLAYAMCDRGVQRLRRDEVVELLEAVRRDYPNIRPVHARTPAAFLAELERRTGLLVEVGEATEAGRPVPVYEFRHLTFQEYLAALALLDGRYPGHQPGTTLADRVRPLAGRIVEVVGEFGPERLVTENWREALRLCVASCNDDDVDPALRAILDPVLPKEARPRAILALLCLADEPNAGPEIAASILRVFVERLTDEDDYIDSGASQAAWEVSRGSWAAAFRGALVAEFIRSASESRTELIDLCWNSWQDTWPLAIDERAAWMEQQAIALTSESEDEAAAAALAIGAIIAWSDFVLVPGIVRDLITVTSRGAASADAALSALQELGSVWLEEEEPKESLPSTDRDALLASLAHYRGNEYLLVAAIRLAASHKLREALPSCIALLRHTSKDVRAAALIALGAIGGHDALAALRATLANPMEAMRRTAVAGIARHSDELTRRLLSRDLDADDPWLDPHEPISAERAREAAERFSVPEDQVRLRYEALAEEYSLRLEWRE